MTEMTARRVLDEGGGVWLPKAYIEICERDITAAMVLAQILFRVRAAHVERDGEMWVTLTYRQWDAELCICESTMRRKLEKLTEFGFIETGVHLIGDEARLHIRPLHTVIDEALLRTVPGGSNLTPPPFQSDRRGGTNLTVPSSKQKIKQNDEEHVDKVDFASTEESKQIAVEDSSPSPRSVEKRARENARENASTEVVQKNLSPQPPSPLDDDGPTAIARRVLAAWVAATGRNPNSTKLSAKRLAKVKARLKDGYTEEEMIAAVQGVTLSAFHMGDNDRKMKYNDMELVLRDGSKLEQFRDLWYSGQRSMPSKPEDALAAVFADAGIDDDTDLSGMFR